MIEPLDPQIATFKVSTLERSEGISELGESIPLTKTEVLETQVCSREELGLEGDNSKFMPVKSVNKKILEGTNKILTCVSQKEKLSVHGDNNTLNTK